MYKSAISPVGVTLLLCSSAMLALAAANLPGLEEASSIIKRSVAANTADWQAQPRFSYREQVIKSKFSGSGQTQPEDEKSYQVLMIEGSPYNKLVAVHNEPLSRLQEDQENEKLQRETARRRNESAADRQSRVSKYRDGRAEEHLLMQQMVDAFNFRYAGEETMNGVECYSFEAIPNPYYRPPVEKARVLTGMRGHMWIDKQHYHWVKVRAEVTQPVSFGFFIARVKPGTSFELEQAPVGNVWLPKHFTQIVNASVFGLYGLRSKEESFYSDYVDSTSPSASPSKPACCYR